MARSRKPKPKVIAATLGAAAGELLTWLASLAGLDMPSGPAMALVVLLTFAFGYITSEN